MQFSWTISRSRGNTPGRRPWTSGSPPTTWKGQATEDMTFKTYVVALPTSKHQCKDGGWKNFGTTFKNQGQCVRFVATGGKHGG